MANPAPPDEDLNTWNEIAAYLRISVREAQYREKNDGLPVHRLPGKKPRVWANRSELDAWKARIAAGAGNLSETTATGGGGSATRRLNRRLVLAGLGGMGLVGGAATLALRPRHVPERAVLTGSLLSAIDGLGRTLWTYRFPGTLRQHGDEEMRWRVQVVDFNGDGHAGVVVVCSFAPDDSARVSAHDELCYFEPDGKLLWTLPCQPDLLDFDGRPFEPTWRYSHALAAPAGNEKALWVGAEHQMRFPGCLLRVDARGKNEVRFANAGNIECLCRVPRTDGEYIAITGENNAFDRAFVAVIGVNDPPSCSPVGGPPRYRFANGPTAPPRNYILFPTVELTKTNSASYGHANRVTWQGGGIVVAVDVVGPHTSLIYEFSDRLQPKVVMPSGSYPVVHRQFEERGLLNHPWSACPDLARPLTIRQWEPEKGWRDQNIPWRLPDNLV